MQRILKTVWQGFVKWSRTPDGSLILLALFFFCWYKIREDYRQGQMEPGSYVIYHGQKYEIDEMTIDGISHKSTLRLHGITKAISSDSVTMAHTIFWQHPL